MKYSFVASAEVGNGPAELPLYSPEERDLLSQIQQAVAQIRGDHSFFFSPEPSCNGKPTH